jgi:hypothetical protein
MDAVLPSLGSITTPVMSLATIITGVDREKRGKLEGLPMALLARDTTQLTGKVVSKSCVANYAEEYSKPM